MELKLETILKFALIFSVFIILLALLPKTHLFTVSSPQPSIGLGYGPGRFEVSPLSVVRCSPDSGYDYCNENDYSYGEAHAHAKIQITNPRDKNGKYGAYMIKEAYINVKCSGDKLYVYKNLRSWNDVKCGRSGCNGQEINNGKYNLAESGEENPGYVAFVCWDLDEDVYGEWAYTWVGRGWLGSGYFNIKIVDCLNNNDCSSGEICLKSGDWKNWKCEENPCNYKQCGDICEGNTRETGGNCKLINYEAKCEYTKTEDCSKLGGLKGSKFCKGNDVYQKSENYICSSGACVLSGTEDKLIKECSYGCENGECLTSPKFPYWIIIIVGIIAGLVGLLIFVMLMHKKFKKV